MKRAGGRPKRQRHGLTANQMLNVGVGLIGHKGAKRRVSGLAPLKRIQKTSQPLKYHVHLPPRLPTLQSPPSPIWQQLLRDCSFSELLSNWEPINSTLLPGPPQQTAEPGRVNSDYFSAILLAFVFFVHHLERNSFESDPNYIVPLVIVVVWTIVLYIERFLKLYLSYCYRPWCEWALRRSSQATLRKVYCLCEIFLNSSVWKKNS